MTQKVFSKKDFLTNFAKLTGKQQCQSLIFNKVADLTFFTEHLRATASESMECGIDSL